MNIFNVQREFQGAFRSRRVTTNLLIHHAGALYPSRNGIDDCRAVQRYHVNNRGWPGIGYHVALAEEVEGGPIARYILSDLSLQRAHILNRNHEFLGVCCLTNFDTHPGKLPAIKWREALVETLQWLRTIYPNATITGHREEAVKGGETTCPGMRWMEWKPGLVRDVGTIVEPWAAWGAAFPLPAEQRGFGIPQHWLTNLWLGACTGNEQQLDTGTVVRSFANGWILYSLRSNTAQAIKRF